MASNSHLQLPASVLPASLPQPQALPCQFMATLLGDQPAAGGCSAWSFLLGEAGRSDRQSPAQAAATESFFQPLQSISAEKTSGEAIQSQPLRDLAAGNDASAPTPSPWASGEAPAQQQHNFVAQQQQHHETNQQHGQTEQQRRQELQEHNAQPPSASSFDLAMDLLVGAPALMPQQLSPHPQQQQQQLPPWLVDPAASIRPLAYKPHHFVSRLSLKLFNCTPADLPDDLRAQLTGWLKSAPAGAEGYMRPGCVHLTLDFLLDSPGEWSRLLNFLNLHLNTRNSLPWLRDIKPFVTQAPKMDVGVRPGENRCHTSRALQVQEAGQCVAQHLGQSNVTTMGIGDEPRHAEQISSECLEQHFESAHGLSVW